MKRSDYFLLCAGSVGLFMAGVVWRPAFGDESLLKDALECTSFLATTIAALVAIYTLRAWKDQFRHAERFATLRSVKDAIADMHLFRGHLLALIKLYRAEIEGCKDIKNKLIENEKVKREQLKAALSVYKKTWVSAVAFFTPEEERCFPGSPEVFMQLYLSNYKTLNDLVESFLATKQADEFYAISDAMNAKAIQLFRETDEAIEAMIRKKI